MYGNESFIKSAIEQWEGGGREDVFIQSNWGETSAVGYEHDPERSLMETLTLLGIEYLDMCECEFLRPPRVQNRRCCQHVTSWTYYVLDAD